MVEGRTPRSNTIESLSSACRSVSVYIGTYYAYLALQHWLYNTMQYMLMRLPNGHVNLVSDRQRLDVF